MEEGGRGGVQGSCPTDTGQACRIEEAIGVEDDVKVVARAGESLDESLPLSRDRIGGGADLFGGYANHLRHGVDRASHRAVADIHDDRSRIGARLSGGKAEEESQIDDRDDCPAEITDADDVRGHVGEPGEPAGGDDFLDSLDVEQAFLPVEFESHKLRGARTRGIWGRRGRHGGRRCSPKEG